MDQGDEFFMAFDPLGFAGGMKRAADAAASLHRRWELDGATWEPHDWSEGWL